MLRATADVVTFFELQGWATLHPKLFLGAWVLGSWEPKHSKNPCVSDGIEIFFRCERMRSWSQLLAPSAAEVP